MNTQEYKVDFKLDIVDEEPFQIKYLVKGQTEYRPITKKDINLYDILSNAQKNNLNKLGLSKNLLISGQLYGEAKIHESIQIMKTQYIPESSFIQLSTVSELLLSVLIHENQTKDQIEQDKQLEEYFTAAKIQKTLTIIIVNPQNIEKLGFQNVNLENEDQCYGKFIIYPQKKIIYLIPKTKQSKFQQMQLIFLGLARHFKPRYLYVQELNYKLQDNIFLKTNFNLWGAICPKKKYDGNRKDPLYLNFLLNYDFYVSMQNNRDSYQFDALNCFYNYQKCDTQILYFISCLGNESLTQDMDHLNPKFCKLLNQDDLCLIQYGQLIQKPSENMDGLVQKIHSIQLNQEIKFIMSQYIELHPSIFRVLLMKLIAIIDYFSISSYLFIIVILPYYFILDQSNNQAIQVFISIIPGFIIIITMIVTIIVTIIFSKDDQISTGEQKQNVEIYVYKKNRISTLVFSLNDSKEKYQIIPPNGKVEREQLLYNLNTEQLKEGENKLKASPIIQFNPIAIFKSEIFIFCSIFYFILSAAVLIIFISNREGDSNKMAYSTAAFLGLLSIFYLIFNIRSLNYNQIGQQIIYLIPMFIETNLLADIFISYNKSHSLELNYYKLQKFLLRLFWNFIIFFTYIILDYSYNFDGGVICPIVGYYVLKYILQIILLCFASTKIKEDQNPPKMEQTNNIGQQLITQEADFVLEEFNKYEREPVQQTINQNEQNQQIKAETKLTESVDVNPPALQSHIQQQDSIINGNRTKNLQFNQSEVSPHKQYQIAQNNTKAKSGITEKQMQHLDELNEQFKKK